MAKKQSGLKGEIYRVGKATYAVVKMSGAFQLFRLVRGEWIMAGQFGSYGMAVAGITNDLAVWKLQNTDLQEYAAKERCGI